MTNHQLDSTNTANNTVSHAVQCLGFGPPPPAASTILHADAEGRLSSGRQFLGSVFTNGDSRLDFFEASPLKEPAKEPSPLRETSPSPCGKSAGVGAIKPLPIIGSAPAACDSKLDSSKRWRASSFSDPADEPSTLSLGSCVKEAPGDSITALPITGSPGSCVEGKGGESTTPLPMTGCTPCALCRNCKDGRRGGRRAGS